MKLVSQSSRSLLSTAVPASISVRRSLASSRGIVFWLYFTKLPPSPASTCGCMPLTCETLQAPTSEDCVPARFVFSLAWFFWWTWHPRNYSFFSHVLSFWTFVDDVGSSIVLGPPACRWPPDEEEPPTMTAGQNALMFFMLLLT